jgi:hypothetical protein
MALGRYTFPDAYILEELRRAYHASDTKGRIRLLQKLYRGEQRPPFEVALLAVEDPDVTVRQWVARHGSYLDYRTSRDESTDRNLVDRLQNDPDPFVRACLRENPTVLHGWSTTDWIEAFRGATHLERLALMRNPETETAHALIQKLFDYEDQELSINLEARKELILAFLTNNNALHRSRDFKRKAGGFLADWEIDIIWSTHAHVSQLWTLISKWPEGSGNLQSVVYRYIGAPDETKAEIYRTCVIPAWRRAILANCDEDDRRTIALGTQDADDLCRELAYTQIAPGMRNVDLQTLLQSEDKAALSGMAANHSLPIGYLRKIADRLSALGDDIGVSCAVKTIEEIQKTRTSEEDENGQEEDKPQIGSMLDQHHQRVRFAASLITIIEYARQRFETIIEGSKPSFIADNGSKAFDTDIEFIEGLGPGTVWLEPDGSIRFTCEIVENNSSLALVRAHLDLIVREIVAYLRQFPARDWEITEDPLSEPYLPRLRAIHNSWKLVIDTSITPRVDNTFDASLDIRAVQ